MDYPSDNAGVLLIESEKKYHTFIRNHENVACLFYQENDIESEDVNCFMEGLVDDHEDTTHFVKMCAPKHPELVAKLNIAKLPTIALIKSGRVIHLVVVPDIMETVTDEWGSDELEKILYDHEIVFKFEETKELLEFDEDWSDSDDCSYG